MSKDPTDDPTRSTELIDWPLALSSRYPAILQPISRPVRLGNAGGLSGARLWRWESASGPLVARAWPSEGPGRAVLERIHGWLAEAGPLGFVPVPRAGLDGRTAQELGGRLGEVAPWMPGRAVADGSQTRSKLRAAFATLGALHRALAHHRRRGTSPGLARRLKELESLRGGAGDRIARALDRAPADPRRDLARRWFDLARRHAPAVAGRLRAAAGRVVRLQPCLRDARAEHFLFTDEVVTGVVDFGAMAIESIAGDLARLLDDWSVTDRATRGEALAAYATVAAPEESELALIDAFERSGALLGGSRWVHWHFFEGRTFEDPMAVHRGLRRGVERVERLAACPLAGG